jgi:hypothetical protein
VAARSGGTGTVVRGLGVLALIVLALIALAGWPRVFVAPALAQETRPPTVDGTVAGGLAVGDELTFRVDAAAVGGWQNLHQVTVVAVSGGQDLEQLTFDIEDNSLEIGTQGAVVGTGATAAGEYFSVNAARMIVTEGGANLSITVPARVINDLPAATRFRLGVIDDTGRLAAVTRDLNVGTEQGLTVGTVIAAVIAALLAGGLVGNLFASRRRPPARLSVYGTIQRRLAEEPKRTRT